MRGIVHQVGEFLKTEFEDRNPQGFRVFACHDYLQLVACLPKLSQPVLLLSVVLRTHTQQEQIGQIHQCQCHHRVKVLCNADSSGHTVSVKPCCCGCCKTLLSEKLRTP